MNSSIQLMLRLARGIIKLFFWLLMILFLIILAYVLYYAVMPDVKYRPFCKVDGKVHYIEGPLRPEYKELLKEGLEEENFYYREEDGNIYISRDQSAGGTDLFWNQYEFFNNFEWRFVRALSKGSGAGGSQIEPPMALLDLIAKTKVGPYERGISGDLALGYFSTCAFKRAGAIWLEEMEDTPGQD